MLSLIDELINSGFVEHIRSVLSTNSKIVLNVLVLSKKISPLLGVNIPKIIFAKVVFPVPLAPEIFKIVPGEALKLMFLNK
jgi:hypothetical protein